MGNCYQRFACTDGVQGLRYLSLCHPVEVGSCFIKNHDWGMLQQDAGDGDTLSFASTELHAVLAAPFVKFCDKVAKTGGSDGFFKIVVSGLRCSKGQVFADGFGEEVGFL